MREKERFGVGQRVKGQDGGEERRSRVAYDWLSMEVDGQPLSVKLTQRERGPAICSKVNGKETRWGGEVCRRGPERLLAEGTGREWRTGGGGHING